MMTLAVTVLVVGILAVVLWKVETRASAERTSNGLKLSDLGQELSRFDRELGALARQVYELDAKVADHLMGAKPPARKAPAKKAAAKKAPAKKATPAKKAPRQRSVS